MLIPFGRRTHKAKEYIAAKRNEMAKSLLRSKISLEDLLRKRLQSLETIETVLLKIDTAVSDIQVCTDWLYKKRKYV